MNIYEKLSLIQLKLVSKKDHSTARYKYRKAEDILEALKPLLKEVKATLIVRENEKEVSGIPAIESVVVLVDLEDPNQKVAAKSIVLIDVEQKGMSMPQRSGASSTYGKKYALGNLFLIDDSSMDPDIEKKPFLSKSHPLFQQTINSLSKGDPDGSKMRRVKDRFVLDPKTEEDFKRLILNVGKE